MWRKDQQEVGMKSYNSSLFEMTLTGKALLIYRKVNWKRLREMSAYYDIVKFCLVAEIWVFF